MDKEIHMLRVIYMHIKTIDAELAGSLFEVIYNLEKMAVTLGFDLPRDDRFNHYIKG